MMAGDELRALANNDELPLTEIIERSEQLVFDITRETIERTEVTLSDALGSVYDDIGRKLEGQVSYMPTGFKALDEAIGGLERGTLTIVGGRPGMGKSSLCTAFGVNAARLGVRAYYISTEMPQQRIAYRIAAMETGISLTALKHAQLTPDELTRIVEAMGRMDAMPLRLDYVPAANPSQVRARVARLMRETGLDLLIIDGLWQMTAPGKYDKDRILQLGYISRVLVDMAKEFNIPVVLAHQLNRRPEERADHRPVMSDLEYSGQLEQNADVILMLYRDEVYNPTTDAANQADVIISKNRDGRTGVVSLYFEKQTAKFRDATIRAINLSQRKSEPSESREVYQ
jgi:replicative DNA helicase